MAVSLPNKDNWTDTRVLQLLCFRHWKPSVPQAFCFSMCPSVSESESRKSCEHHTSETRECYFAQFWSQMWFEFGVKGQFHTMHWPKKLGEYNNIFVTVGANFTKIRSHMYLGLRTYWLGFRSKGQGHCRRRHRCLRHPVEFHVVFNILRFSVHRYLTTFSMQSGYIVSTGYCRYKFCCQKQYLLVNVDCFE